MMIRRCWQEFPSVISPFQNTNLKRTLHVHGIEPHNIWNIGEKGFMLGRARVIFARTRRNPRLEQDRAKVCDSVGGYIWS